jgi:HK97 family phage major capsid protein
MTLEQLRAAYRAACERVQTAVAAVEALADDAAAEEVTRVTDAFNEARTSADQAKGALDAREAVERAREAHPAPTPADPTPAPDVRVTRNEPTYRPDQGSFFRDLIAAKGGNSGAYDRLQRNNAEYIDEMQRRVAAHPTDARIQQRAGLTQTAGAGGEFIAPIWMIDQTEPLLRAARPFADQCSGYPLPEFTNSINVPKITTGASTAVQTDTSNVSNTDLVTTSVTAQVQTIAGRTVAAYQDIDLGGPIVEQLVYQDLLADYWRTLDQSLISGNVTNAKGVLNVSGINAVTFTNASPTPKDFWAPWFQGKSQIEKGAFVPTQFGLVHPSTWNFILSGLDSQNRPLATPGGYPGFNLIAQNNDAVAQGVAGNMGGIPIVEDANVPVNLGGGTNEARIVLANKRTLVTFEGVPRFKVADQTSITTLQYQFVLYGYYGAAFPRQPKMISVVSGTGLVVQSGF